jgi:hypothetical protein
MALAFGLAFGLGGRAVAEEMSRNWYERSVQMAARISETSDTPATPGAAPAQPPQRPTPGG